MNGDRCMSLFGVTASNCLGCLVNALPQRIWSQYLGVVLKAQHRMHQPVISGGRAAKTEQTSVFPVGLNGVAKMWIAFHHQYPAGAEQDAHFWIRRMVKRKRG